MKKIILILSALVFTFGVEAQKLKIQSALNAIKSGEIEKAKQYIDEATENESTSKDSKAWLVKAFVYQAIGTDILKNPQTGQALPFIANINGQRYDIDLEQANSLRPSTEKPLLTALNAFNKYLYYDKKPNDAVVATSAYALAATSYNQGGTAFKNKNYADAMDAYAMVEKVNQLKKGAFFSSLNDQEFGKLKQQMSSMLANSIQYSAYSAYYLGDDNVTLPLIERCMQTPGAADDNIYLMAANIYKNTNEMEKYKSTLKHRLKKYPDSKALMNEDLNFTVTSGGDPEAAAKKLQAAIDSDPSAPELRFNLGVMYDKLSMAVKEDAKQNEYFDKAVASYKKAIELDGKNSDYQYNLGALYFNKAKGINDAMNQLPLGDNNYDKLKVQRDTYMSNAMPYLEQAKSTLEAKGLGDEMDSATYKNTLIALKSVYSILGKLDKAKTTGELLDKQ